MSLCVALYVCMCICMYTNKEAPLGVRPDCQSPTRSKTRVNILVCKYINVCVGRYIYIYMYICGYIYIYIYMYNDNLSASGLFPGRRRG